MDRLINFTPMNFTSGGTMMAAEGENDTSMEGCMTIIKDNKKGKIDINHANDNDNLHKG